MDTSLGLIFRVRVPHTVLAPAGYSYLPNAKPF